MGSDYRQVLTRSAGKSVWAGVASLDTLGLLCGGYLRKVGEGDKAEGIYRLRGRPGLYIDSLEDPPLASGGG